MTTLTALADAQERIDDGRPQPGDHDCAVQLERLLQESAWRILDDENRRDLARWVAWHDEICDGGDDCRHRDEED